MSALAIEIADGVKTLIANATLTVDLTATVPKLAGGWPASASVIRTYLAQYNSEDLAYLRCTVLPTDYDQQRMTRGGSKREEYGVDVILQKRADDDSDSDELMLVTQEIGDVLASDGNDLSLTGTTAYWVKQERSALFKPEDFDELSLFTAPMRHTYRLYR